MTSLYGRGAYGRGSYSASSAPVYNPEYGAGVYGTGPYGYQPGDNPNPPTPSPGTPLTGTYPLHIGVWRAIPGSNQWAKQGDLRTWTDADVEPVYLAGGPWSFKTPLDKQSARIGDTDLLTFDLQRGDDPPYRVMTGVIKSKPLGADNTGAPTYEMSGIDALGLLGVNCWPNPDQPITNQTAARYLDSGPAETVLRRLIVANWNTRLNMGLAIASSQGRGANIDLSLRFHNMLNMAAIKADAAGIGFRMGLVETTSATRAQMVLEFTEPRDLSQRARLSYKVGSLQSWKHTKNAPTATRVIVGGPGSDANRAYSEVVATDQETAWKWPVETFVMATDAASEAQRQTKGREALAATVAQTAFELEAVDAKGMRLGKHFDLGDTVGIELATGVTASDVLRGVKVTGGGGAVVVTLIPGNPEATSALFRQAALIRGIRADVDQLQRED